MHPPLVLIAAAHEQPIALVFDNRHDVPGELLRHLTARDVRLGEHRRDRGNDDGAIHR